MADKERIDRAPVLGEVEDVTDYAIALNAAGLVRRLEKLTAERDELRAHWYRDRDRAVEAEATVARVRALAEGWATAPPDLPNHELWLALGRALDGDQGGGLLDEDGGA